MSAERDEVAEVLARELCKALFGEWGDLSDNARARYMQRAHAVLASDWLARREEMLARMEDRWLPFGWHACDEYASVRLEFDGEDEAMMPIWERAITSQEAT